MKINKLSLAVLAIAFGAASCGNEAPKETVETSDAKEVTSTESAEAVEYAVVTEGDEVYWEGYKTLNVGDSHNGTIQVTEGSISTEGGELVGGSFTIDMTSIHSVDLAEDPQMYQKLVGHLKSPDFFAVDSFPTATFEITGVEKAAEGGDGSHKISGNLTMRGITKNISFPATVAMEGDMLKLQTPEFAIDRSQWNVKFNSTSFTEFADIAKDKAIDNNIKLEVKLAATKA